MIIWGTRTKRDGVGFVIESCPGCRVERVHFVARSVSKFTLYFVPTFTTSTKALLICTTCERVIEHGGDRARQLLAGAAPQEVIVTELRRRELAAASASSAGGADATPERTLALGLLVMAMGVAFADGDIEDNEAAAVVQALDTIASATTSEAVRAAARLGVDEFGELLEWSLAPASGPLELMLAQAGTEARNLPSVDHARYIGQLAWLGHAVANASATGGDAELSWMDRAFEVMGVSLRDVVSATRLCAAEGG